jgi:hypothetical protein
MNPSSKAEYMDRVVKLIARHFENAPVSQSEIQTFMKSMAVDDLNPDQVYKEYKQSLDKRFGFRRL